MSIAAEYRLQDALAQLATAQSVTSTAYQDETRLDFKRAAGCPHAAIVVTVGTLPTGGDLTVKIFESADDSNYDEIANKAQLVALATAGDYLLLVNNKIITKRYAKLQFVPASFPTGGAVEVSAYIAAILALV
jgi:hypothetical protein